MTGYHKPTAAKFIPHKPAAKKPHPRPQKRVKPAHNPRKPVVLPAIVGAALVVPNLTMRLGSRLYDWLRNR